MNGPFETFHCICVKVFLKILEFIMVNDYYYSKSTKEKHPSYLEKNVPLIF